MSDSAEETPGEAAGTTEEAASLGTERFGEVAEQYDPTAVEARVSDHWDAVSAYEQTKEHRADGEEFYFLDGPPFTSGAAHMGTTWNKSLKDAHIRYRRMQGYDVTDTPGWDMHGLPIETKVEEEFGFQNKKDIEEFGVERFIEECKSFAEGNLDAMTEDFQSVGVWMDWENPYRTLDPEFMEAAWWAFGQAHERGLVEQGKRSINQCPRCETAIADTEVEYHEIESPSIYVEFPLEDREGSLVIWTTTPWTIPANTFVAVDPELTYQGVRATAADGTEDVLYLAEPCVEDVLSEGRYQDYEVIEELSGEELVGWEYDHPLREEVPDHASFEGSLEVYAADYVEADRTGLVHSAPGHGQEDFQRGAELGLDVFCPVGEDGTFTDAGGEYAGTFVREANEDVIADLEDSGLLLAAGTHRHRYGQCWRCETDIVFLATDQWFITATDVKDDLLSNIDDSEWHPQWARDARFRDFVSESRDWNVSRQRYWGTPIPIWQCETPDCEQFTVVATREELAERAHQNIDPDTLDLHKPAVDPLTMDCESCGGTAQRVPDVFDVWLDSGVTSWGSLSYPSETEKYETLWPADLIIEAHDQTRGWFWSQLGMGTAAVDELPYEEVLMHGHALDEDGRKMSKSVGNVVQPDEAIERHGADPMRLFLLSFTAQGDDMRFSWDEMAEMQRRLNILWNVFRFPLPYMRMDDFEPEATQLDTLREDLEPIDEWVLSRLQTVKGDMDAHWDAFEQDKALEELLEFVVEDVSRYYVQEVRERMWVDADTTSKQTAYATLYRVLREVVTMLAPYAPFVSEEIYQQLTGQTGHDTVHMCDWPAIRDEFHDPTLEDEVETVRQVEEAGSYARQRADRKLRWPVSEVVVDATDETVADAIDAHCELLSERLNARKLTVLEPGDSWGELAYSADADMSVLGPELGEDADTVMGALNEARVDSPDLEALEAAVGDATETEVELTDEMVELVAEPPADAAGAGFEDGQVYVDAELDDDIESEGYAREIIRRVQDLRKEMDLEMNEPIRLDVMVFDDRVAKLVAEREELITEAVRADELGEIDDGLIEEYEIEGVTVRLAIRQIPGATA